MTTGIARYTAASSAGGALKGSAASRSSSTSGRAPTASTMFRRSAAKTYEPSALNVRAAWLLVLAEPSRPPQRTSGARRAGGGACSCDIVDQPFSPLEAMPWTKYFWPRANTTAIGRTESTEPVMIAA